MVSPRSYAAAQAAISAAGIPAGVVEAAAAATTSAGLAKRAKLARSAQQQPEPPPVVVGLAGSDIAAPASIVLFVGEGDFSFSRTLVELHHWSFINAAGAVAGGGAGGDAAERGAGSDAGGASAGGMTGGAAPLFVCTSLDSSEEVRGNHCGAPWMCSRKRTAVFRQR